MAETNVGVCERCEHAQGEHNGGEFTCLICGCDGYAPMTLREQRTRTRIAERRTAALWYAWGAEDTGDRRLRDASGERVMAMSFADFAAAECERYVRERATSLSNIGDQYARFVAALTVGSRFVSDATGDTFRVLAYNAAGNTTFAAVVDGPHGCPSSVPIGGQIAFTPNVLAGYRLVELSGRVEPAGPGVES